MNITTILLAATISVAGTETTTNTAHFGRIDRSKFHIFSSAQTPFTVTREDQLKAIADCGIDLFGAKFTPECLDLCPKYGIQVVGRGLVPGWWGGSAKDIHGKMHLYHPLDKYEKYLKAIKPHPSIVSIELGDEPRAQDFKHFGDIVKLVDKYTDSYLNLFPSYASAGSLSLAAAKSQLGTDSYEEHLALYCKYVPIDEICFDNYVYGWKERADKLLENLRIAADAALASGKHLTVELQAKTFSDKKGKGSEMNENRLRYQCNTALAFGATQINWINFWSSWWSDHIWDKNGNIVNPKLYEQLKVVNRELRLQGDILVKYLRTHTDFVNFDRSKDGLEKVKALSVPCSSGPAFSQVRSMDGKALLVGHFVSRQADGQYAAFLVAAEDPMDVAEAEREVRFCTCKAFSVMGSMGAMEAKKVGENEYSLKLRSNHAVILLTDK